MADAKISAFPAAVAITAIDKLPVLQNGANVVGTAGQIRTYVRTPIVSTITGAAIPSTSEVVLASGLCTLGAGTVIGSEITIVGTGVGKVSAVGLLPSDGFTFGAGNILKVIWVGTVWNVISNNGMVVGIV